MTLKKILTQPFLSLGYLNGGDLIQMKLLHCKEEHFSVALSSAEDILSTKPISKK